MHMYKFWSGILCCTHIFKILNHCCVIFLDPIETQLVMIYA